MNDKICMITGANSGIGKATAVALARTGATVVMVSRDRARGEEAQREIKQTSSNEAVDLLLADLSSQQAVRDLTQEFQQRYSQLHVLINNAGSIFLERRVSIDGLEMTLAVNHMASFLLTNLLLDTLIKSAPARIINLASSAQANSMHLDDLQGEKRYRAMQAYGQSKLAVVLFTYALAQRLTGTGITVNCVDPGMAATNITDTGIDALPKPLAISLKPFTPLIRRLLITPEQGAQTSIYLATSPEIEDVTGKYFVKCQEKQSTPVSYDKALQDRVWKISAELTGLSI